MVVAVSDTNSAGARIIPFSHRLAATGMDQRHPSAAIRRAWTDPDWGQLDFDQRIERIQRYENEPPPRPSNPYVRQGTGGGYGAQALADEAATVAQSPEGCRNQQLNTSAFNLGQLVASGYLDEQTVIDELTHAARHCGLDESEIAATITSGLTAGKKLPRQVQERPPIAASYTIDGPPPPDELTSVAVEGDWVFVDGASFVLDTPAEVAAIWGEGTDVLMARGESLMIVGPMGLGKTTLATLIIHAGLGLGDGLVLGLPVRLPAGPVLYLAMDRPAQIARAMARRFTEADREVLADRLRVWRGPPPGDLAHCPELLVRLAEKAGAVTVVLDSIKDAAIGLSDDAVGAGYNRARQMLLADGRELLELHHTVKRNAAGGAPTSAADVYGSAWIANGTGSIVMLSGEPGDPLVGFRHIRQPMAEVGPYTLVHDQDAGTMSVLHSTDLVELARAKGVDGLTAAEAAVAIFELPNGTKPTAPQREKARRRLDKLATTGLLTRVGGDTERAPVAWFPVEGLSIDG